MLNEDSKKIFALNFESKQKLKTGKFVTTEIWFGRIIQNNIEDKATQPKQLQIPNSEALHLDSRLIQNHRSDIKKNVIQTRINA